MNVTSLFAQFRRSSNLSGKILVIPFELLIVVSKSCALVLVGWDKWNIIKVIIVDKIHSTVPRLIFEVLFNFRRRNPEDLGVAAVLQLPYIIRRYFSSRQGRILIVFDGRTDS